MNQRLNKSWLLISLVWKFPFSDSDLIISGIQVIFQETFWAGDDSIFLCECGKLVRGGLREDTFKAYVNTARNPSTRTIGHRNCGIIFDFVDGEWKKKYSSRKELKTLAIKFAECNKLSPEIVARFLLEVDRLKSCGKLSDDRILVYAYQNALEAMATVNQLSE